MGFVGRSVSAALAGKQTGRLKLGVRCCSGTHILAGRCCLHALADVGDGRADRLDLLRVLVLDFAAELTLELHD